MTQIHETYIKKYVSCKDYSIVYQNAMQDFDAEYNDDTDQIVCRNIDFVLFFMSRKEFMGLIRYTVILYNKFHDNKLKIIEKHTNMGKKAIVESYCKINSDFPIYLTASLYSYI